MHHFSMPFWSLIWIIFFSNARSGSMRMGMRVWVWILVLNFEYFFNLFVKLNCFWIRIAEKVLQWCTFLTFFLLILDGISRLNSSHIKKSLIFDGWWNDRMMASAMSHNWAYIAIIVGLINSLRFVLRICKETTWTNSLNVILSRLKIQ